MKPGRQKRWVVRAGDGDTVGEIVRRAGEPASAIAEGRVFIGRVRAREASEAVRPGVEVTIGLAPTPGPRSRATPAWAMLWMQRGLLAVAKPSGIPTVPDRSGSAHSLVALAARAAGRAEADLRVTSRLDRDVSGVVVFALSPEAEAALVAARRKGTYRRRYVAIARDRAEDAGRRLPDEGVWSEPIGGGKDALHRAVGGPDAKDATTRYRVVARASGFVMLAVEPVTGRTHQIRVHSAHAGAPLLGDRDYGGPARVTLDDGRVVALARIALHAARVTVPDPDGAPLTADAPVPDELTRVWAELGGEAEAWNTAVSCVIEGS